MNSNQTAKEKLLFLEFNEKLPIELLQNKIFIRLVDLEDKNPLIQVNDLIFKGIYDYSIGTNLFFKKVRNETPSEFPFRDPTLFKLDCTDFQTKVLHCKQMKVPSAAAQLPADQQNVKFNFKWDYKELLKKFEQGTLDLNDMMAPETSNELPRNTNAIKEMPQEKEPEPVEAKDLNEHTEIIDSYMDVAEIKRIEEPFQEEPVNEPCDELRVAYENLQILARTPVKREIECEECLSCPEYKNKYEYRSMECKVLEPPLFSYMKNQSRPDNYVNLQRCVTLGLLLPSDVCPRSLSDAERKIVMTVDNFENLDLRARYSILVSHMEKLEKQVRSNRPKQNCIKDEYDRTPVETLRIFNRLVLALQRRLQEMYVPK